MPKYTYACVLHKYSLHWDTTFLRPVFERGLNYIEMVKTIELKVSNKLELLKSVKKLKRHNKPCGRQDFEDKEIYNSKASCRVEKTNGRILWYKNFLLCV